MMRYDHTPALPKNLQRLRNDKAQSRRKRILLVACAAVSAACLFVIANGKGGTALQSFLKSGTTSSTSGLNSTAPQERGGEDQDYASYRHLFSHVAHLKKQAEAADAKGEHGGRFRHLYKNAATLSDQQATDLEEIALDCEREVSKLDAKALKIVKAFRERIQKLTPGEPPPSPPEELKVLQEEKNRTILLARDRLRARLGGNDFDKFDQFLKRDVSLKIERRPVTEPKL